MNWIAKTPTDLMLDFILQIFWALLQYGLIAKEKEFERSALLIDVVTSNMHTCCDQ
jgi:hypothetical protein